MLGGDARAKALLQLGASHLTGEPGSSEGVRLCNCIIKDKLVTQGYIASNYTFTGHERVTAQTQISYGIRI